MFCVLILSNYPYDVCVLNLTFHKLVILIKGMLRKIIINAFSNLKKDLYLNTNF